MSLMPWGNYGGMLSPFNDFSGLDPFGMGNFDVVPRTVMPSMRRMERELGKLISSVKEDDKSFQVIIYDTFSLIVRFLVINLAC